MNRDLFDNALDRWLSREPEELPYSFDDYIVWAHEHPDAGYDPSSVNDYELWCDMRAQDDMDARGEIAAERAADDRDDDDRAYWAGL
jgi:hypothetical protein